MPSREKLHLRIWTIFKKFPEKIKIIATWRRAWTTLIDSGKKTFDKSHLTVEKSNEIKETEEFFLKNFNFF